MSIETAVKSSKKNASVFLYMVAAPVSIALLLLSLKLLAL